MTNGSDRLDRIERILEQMAQIQQGAATIQGQQQEQIQALTQNLADAFQTLTNAIQTLADTAADHAARLARQDALIERLDAIIERMVYREGRDGNGEQQR